MRDNPIRNALFFDAALFLLAFPLLALFFIPPGIVEHFLLAGQIRDGRPTGRTHEIVITEVAEWRDIVWRTIGDIGYSVRVITNSIISCSPIQEAGDVRAGTQHLANNGPRNRCFDGMFSANMAWTRQAIDEFWREGLEIGPTSGKALRAFSLSIDKGIASAILG